MYFRCAECLTSTWIDRLEPVGPSDVLTCGGCGLTHTVKPVKGLGRTLGDHYGRTVKLANSASIDMPSAYSVLLGITTLEEIHLLQGRDPAEAPQIEPAREVLLPDIDPGFQTAVADGYLTVEEAARRGDREAFASKLAARHGLARELAYQVADNRLSLREALKRKPAAAAPVSGKPAAEAVTRLQAFPVVALGVLVVAAIGWNEWTASFEAREPPRTIGRVARGAPLAAGPSPVSAGVPPASERSLPRSLRAASNVRTDDAGRIVEVVGPDPATVLLAYCEAVPAALRPEPLGITETIPARHDSRLGLFRDYDSDASVRAIRIYRDWRTRRWVAGDGRGPVWISEAPELPPGAFRVTIRGR